MDEQSCPSDSSRAMICDEVVEAGERLCMRECRSRIEGSGSSRRMSYVEEVVAHVGVVLITRDILV